MSIWVIIVVFAAIKVPLAALMLWIPFRSDSALQDDEPGDATDGKDDGGIKDGDGPPRGPHPRSPRRWPRRRGPHGSPSSPARFRRGPRLLPRRRRVPAGR